MIGKKRNPQKAQRVNIPTSLIPKVGWIRICVSAADLITVPVADLTFPIRFPENEMPPPPIRHNEYP